MRFSEIQLNTKSEVRAERVNTTATTGTISGGRSARWQTISLPREEHVFVASMDGPTLQSDGFRLSSFTMKSIGASVSPLQHQLKTQRWTYGVLLREGDTQFFELPPDDSSRDVIVWVEAGTGKGSNADIDLFIGLDRNPTAQSSDFSARGSSFGEAIRIPRGSRHRVVAAVQAYSGAMWFRIHAARLSIDNEYYRLTAGFTYTPLGPTDLADATSALRSARRSLFGATLGRRVIRNIDITIPTKPDKCVDIDLCFRNVAGTSHANFHTIFSILELASTAQHPESHGAPKQSPTSSGTSGSIFLMST